MKPEFLLLILLMALCSETASAQHRFQQRNIAWFTPSRADEINGLAIGAFPASAMFKKNKTAINGLNADVHPLGLVVWAFVIGGSLVSPVYTGDEAGILANKNVFEDSAAADIVIKGVNVSVLGSYGETSMSGVSITPIAFIGQEVKGVSGALLMNRLYSFKGLLIAGLQNKVTKGSGVQIGLFNYCKGCRGLQIGLLNKNGRRMLPILNFR